MSTSRNHRAAKHDTNDDQEGAPDRGPPDGFSGGAAVRPRQVVRVDAVSAPAANDNVPVVGTTQWTIVRHFAEFTLGIAVYNSFKDCHGLFDAFKVISDANDDLKRLGIITAITIATSGLTGMVKAATRGCGLPRAMRAIHRALGALIRVGRAWRRSR